MALRNFFKNNGVSRIPLSPALRRSHAGDNRARRDEGKKGIKLQSYFILTKFNLLFLSLGTIHSLYAT